MKTLISIWRSRHNGPEPWWYSALAAVAFLAACVLILLAV